MDFTHTDSNGNAIVVDVGGKPFTERRAVAVGKIIMSAECFSKVYKGAMKKGDVLTVAQLAGIMGAKKTSDLIPLCHLLNLTSTRVTFEMLSEENAVVARCEAACLGQTGVEMEALTGVSVALLTIYDMCKAVDRSMTITDIHLTEKSGGKSGTFLND